MFSQRIFIDRGNDLRHPLLRPAVERRHDWESGFRSRDRDHVEARTDVGRAVGTRHPSQVELVLGLGGRASDGVEDAVVAADAIAAEVEGPVHREEDAVVVDDGLVVHPGVSGLEIDDIGHF